MTLPDPVDIDLDNHLRREEKRDARDEALEARAKEIEDSLLSEPVGFDELMEHIADDLTAVARFNALGVRVMKVQLTFEAYETVRKLQQFFREHAKTLAMSEARAEMEIEEFRGSDQ